MATLTVVGTYWVLVGDGTCWRNPVHAAEMCRVTLKEEQTNQTAQNHTHSFTQACTQLQLLLRGILRHKLWMNHTLTLFPKKHAKTFSLAVSHHFGSGKEWRLCFTDKLTHLWRRWGNLLVSKCVQHHTGRPESTPYSFFSESTSGTDRFTNNWKQIALSSQSWSRQELHVAAKVTQGVYSLRMGYTLVVPFGALHHVVQQQGAAPA